MPRIALLRDRRALSIAIPSLIGFLIIIALLGMFVEPAFTPIMDKAANETTNSTAQAGNNDLRFLFNNLQLWALIVAAVGVITAAVYARQGF